MAPPNTSATSAPASPPPFNLNTISQGISTADFYLERARRRSCNFLETDSHTKMVAKPQLRGAEGTKLTMNLGDEIPVALDRVWRGCRGRIRQRPAMLVQLPDIGVNLEMTPRVTYDGEIVLDAFSVESSALGPRSVSRARTFPRSLAQGDDEAPAARRRVDAPGGIAER